MPCQQILGRLPGVFWLQFVVLCRNWTSFECLARLPEGLRLCGSNAFYVAMHSRACMSADAYIVCKRSGAMEIHLCMFGQSMPCKCGPSHVEPEFGSHETMLNLMCVCIYVCLCMYLYVCMHVCMYLCMYVCMFSSNKLQSMA